MKLTGNEQCLVDLLRSAGGSICPGDRFVLGFEAKRVLRRLERQGVVRIEPTDDGFRYSLAGDEHG